MPEELENNPEFADFLAGRMRDKGITLKRLSDMTGIAPGHIENLLRGDFEDMPSAPYLHGYIVRVGKALDFDGEESWKKIKNMNVTQSSGATDALPQNRFIKREAPKWIWLGGIAALILVIYLAIALPRILGRPSLTVNDPPQNPWNAAGNTLVLRGTVRNADAIYLSNANVSSSDAIPIAADGTWSKTVLLGSGPNDFVITARKFLGSEVSVTQRIIYTPAGGAPTYTATSSATSE